MLIVLGDTRIQKGEDLYTKSKENSNDDVKDGSKTETTDLASSIANLYSNPTEGDAASNAKGCLTESNVSDRKGSSVLDFEANTAVRQLLKGVDLSGKVVNELSKDSKPSNEGEIVDQKILTNMCLNAMRQCLQRFPQHYKSLHRLADYHYHSKINKNYHWSRDFLLGRSIPWQQIPHMPSQGLFNERKNSNLFNGIWRIPNDEIDRPGSFVSHMYRSVILLAKVLIQLRDFFVLVNLITQLFRTPETGKKFLRDSDRLIVANMVQNLTLNALRDEMKRLCSSEKSAETQDKIIKHILSVYRVWHNLLKGSDSSAEVNHLFEEVFRMYLKYTDTVEAPNLLEQALKFCQQQLTLSRSPKVNYISATDFVRSVSLPSGIENDRKGGDIDDEKLPSSKHSIKLPSMSDPSSKNLAQWKALEKKDISATNPISASKPKLTLKDVVTSTSSSDSKLMKSSNWAPSNIPSSGVVIGSMTITPVGTPTPTTTSAPSTPTPPSEGLLGRLASSKPRSPLNLSTVPAAKTPSSSSSTKFNAPFDPSRLTADVQSKISSLDPVEHASRSTHTSGFQMEFLRQITQNQNIQPTLSAAKTPSVKPRGRGAGAAKIIHHQSHGQAHSVWGNRAPIATPTSTPRSSDNSLSISYSAKFDPVVVIKKELSATPCQLKSPYGDVSSTSLLPKTAAVSGSGVSSSSDKTGEAKPCAVQLRSIRISSITQESAKLLLPTGLPTTTKPSAIAIPPACAKPAATESAVELITLSSSPSPDGSTIND